MMNKCKIARCLSILICILYMSFSILAFSFTSENANVKSSDKLQIHKIKKEVPIVYNELEDNEEETDFSPIFTFQEIDYFGLVTALGEVSHNFHFYKQPTPLNIHLPIWLTNRHIIQ